MTAQNLATAALAQGPSTAVAVDRKTLAQSMFQDEP
jgi:hypothetical protein